MPEQPERFVFGPFWNGAEFVYVDPLEANRALVGHARGRLAQLIEDSKVRGPEDSPEDSEEQRANKQVLRDRANAVAFPAINEMMKITRLAFDMIPFDPKTGKGALEADCHRVLTDFFDFVGAQKKSGVPSQTSVRPTASPEAA